MSNFPVSLDKQYYFDVHRFIKIINPSSNSYTSIGTGPCSPNRLITSSMELKSPSCGAGSADSTGGSEFALDSFEQEVVPSVDLPVHVGLRHLCLNLVLVTCDGKFLSIVSIVIGRVHNENKLGHLSSVSLSEFKIVHSPSKPMERVRNQANRDGKSQIQIV